MELDNFHKNFPINEKDVIDAQPVWFQEPIPYQSDTSNTINGFPSYGTFPIGRAPTSSTLDLPHSSFYSTENSFPCARFQANGEAVLSKGSPQQTFHYAGIEADINHPFHPGISVSTITPSTCSDLSSDHSATSTYGTSDLLQPWHISDLDSVHQL